MPPTPQATDHLVSQGTLRMQRLVAAVILIWLLVLLSRQFPESTAQFTTIVYHVFKGDLPSDTPLYTGPLVEPPSPPSPPSPALALMDWLRSVSATFRDWADPKPVLEAIRRSNAKAWGIVRGAGRGAA
ncbi:hypothetical protein CALVIDRAFT_33946 [Calocera viscosa TUFC12733]|uniref:Uncharacterized protein n=1 Tax=Calocera viscosa (strain TUFC12733) TaxID=1330018 RepID=A0A167FPG6_CALVF|nr:hypothetical protein CALVIDRAFT_33946 [Calocera viscosa TUFC12733]